MEWMRSNYLLATAAIAGDNGDMAGQTAVLTLKTLGKLTIRLNKQPLQRLASRKAEALLIYLACNPDLQPRGTLATLLWDDRPQQRALGNLSVLLSSLRKQLSPFLRITSQSIGINQQSNLQVDALTFAKAISNLQVSNFPLLELYTGDFLGDFHIRKARGFEEWVLLERERLQRLAIEGLQTAVLYHQMTRQWETAVSFARRWLALDPLNEQVHQQMIELLALQGKRAAALNQYESCRELLATELGIEPAVEMRLLYERLKAGDSIEIVGDLGKQQAALPQRMHNLPAETTPFVGREAELATIFARLQSEDCRLLTLMGAGGMGKTRLALRLAAQQVGRFPQGVWFVPLVEVVGVEGLITAVSTALDFPLSGSTPPQEQLFNYLRHKALLLVLDNFEQLLTKPDVVDFVLTLLQQAPMLKLLVTSRERLNVQAEWLVEVAGFAAGEDGLALFRPSARRVQAGFEWRDEVEKTAVSHICQQVDQMPLAIQLAAAWVPLLSLADISREIEQNLDILATRLRDVPRRQQSIRAVFVSSWQRLSSSEQAAFRRLSLFRGGFSAAAARAVAGCSLFDLLGLVNKSLAHRVDGGGGNGRFQLHELLRQYGREQLDTLPTEKSEMQQQLATYFTQFLSQLESDWKSARQKTAVQTVDADAENVRAAWHWLIQEQAYEQIDQMFSSFVTWYILTNRYQALERQLALLAAGLSQAKTLTARKLFLQVLLWQAATALGLGSIEMAEQFLLQSQHLFEELDGLSLDIRREKALYARFRGAYLHDFAGDFAEAIRQHR